MKVDMKKYLASHDLVYRSAPKIWQDALVCGNGHLGALFFAPFFPEFLINKADIWDYETVRGKLAKHKDVMKVLKQGKELNAIVASTGFAGAKIASPKTGAKLRLRFGKDDNWTGGYKTSGRLSIYDGVLHTAMDRHLSHPRLESFVHSGSNLFCLRAKDVSALVDGSVKIELMRPADYAYDPPKFGNEKDVIWMKMSLPENFHYVVAARAVSQGSAAYMDYMKKHYRAKYWKRPTKTVSTSIEPDRASLTAAGEFELFISVVTSKESKNPLKDALKLVNAAGAAGFGNLHKEHVKWWDGFWKKSFINLSDKILEQIWYTSVYVQASQYRTSPVPGLQGLWFGGPGIDGSQQLQWRGNYTNDQNTEIVPMPFFSANHRELVEPFYDTFNAMIPQAKKDTREAFGMRGMHFPLSCGPDGKTYQHGTYGYIHCGGPYHGLIYCWGWEYFKDRKLLKEKIYPFIKEICSFFADYMIFDEETQKYRLYPSQPPEVPFLDVGNPTHTLSLLKVNLKTAVKASGILGVDKNDRKKWIHLLEHYPEYPMDEGIFVEGDTVPARHYISQSGGLYPAFPCGEFGEDSPEEILKAAKKTFWSVYTRQTLASYAQAKGRHFVNAWEVFFHTMQALRLGLKREAWNLLYQEFLRCFMKPNGLFSHNAIILADPAKSEANLANIPEVKLLDGSEEMPLREPLSTGYGCTENLEAKEQVFSCIEDSSIFLTIVNEMLFQSHGGILRLFPACPAGWSAAFKDFRAQGAFLVSSSMKKGKVEFVTIKALAGGTITLKNPWPGKKVTVKRKRTHTEKLPVLIKLTFKQDEAASLYARRLDFQRAQNTVVENDNKNGPKRLRFYDGSRAWLGKPELSEYYKW